MSVILARNWWSLIIRGLTAIVLAAITVLWSDITNGQLILVFFAYAMIDGLVGIAGAVRAAEQHERWGSLLIDGLVCIAAAVVAVAWPGMFKLIPAVCHRSLGHRQWSIRNRRGVASQKIGVGRMAAFFQRDRIFPAGNPAGRHCARDPAIDRLLARGLCLCVWRPADRAGPPPAFLGAYVRVRNTIVCPSNALALCQFGS